MATPAWSPRVIIATYCLTFLTTGTRGMVFKYLGCYQDQQGTGRDMAGNQMSFAVMTVDTCATQCQQNKFPYAGIQLGKVCYCGMSYGSHGASIACNTTCDNQYCGGYLANDVYYAIDPTIAATRTIILHTEAKNFNDARQECVKNNGDLLATTSPSIMNDMRSIIQNSNSSTSIPAVWIGLRRPTKSSGFEWTNSTTASYNSLLKAVAVFWDPGDSMQNMCVKYNVSIDKWQSTTCDVVLPFVCSQLPPADINLEVNSTQATEADVTTVTKAQLIALYVVLPIFLLCYGGSCVIYCIYKIHHNCSRGYLLTKAVNLETIQEDDAPLPPCRLPPAYPAQRQEMYAARRLSQFQIDGYVIEPVKKPIDYGMFDTTSKKRPLSGAVNEGADDTKDEEGGATAAPTAAHTPAPGDDADQGQLNNSNGASPVNESIGDLLKKKMMKKGSFSSASGNMTPTTPKNNESDEV